MLAIARYVCALRLDRTPFERAARSRPKNSQALSLNLQTIQALTAAATPFLRIDGIKPVSWCRNVQSGSRFGPWRYQAVFAELDGKTWQREGEVIYFVTDRQSQLRRVGESGGRLKDRWRMSPMHDVTTRAPLGRKALFHSTAWGPPGKASVLKRRVGTEPELLDLIRLGYPVRMSNIAAAHAPFTVKPDLQAGVDPLR